MTHCLNIPRYSQRFEPGEWPADTLCKGEGPDYWSDRVCGLACLRMIIAYYKRPVPSQYELLIKGIEKNCYSPRGWIHQGLARLGRDDHLNGIPVKIENGDQLQHLLEMKGSMIASVTHTLPQDGRRGGHLIVICGRQKQPAAILPVGERSTGGIRTAFFQQFYRAEHLFFLRFMRCVFVQSEEGFPFVTIKQTINKQKPVSQR